MDLADPEVDEFEFSVDEKGVHIGCAVRIVRVCSDCGVEMKEANEEEGIDLTWADMKLPGKPEGEEEITIEEDSVDQLEESGGRFKKSYFGATVNYSIKHGDTVLHTGQIELKVAAGDMEEIG
jgi:hypothetical protein